MANISDDLKDKIRQLVKEVVVQEHTNSQKQMIKDMHGRIAIACPFCGDSTKDGLKKRGNLFWDTLQYHCYNCGEHSDVHTFLKHFGFRLSSSEDSLAVIDIVKENRMSVVRTESLQHAVLLQAAELAIPIQDFKKFTKAVSIEPGDFAWFYLKGRMLHNMCDDFLYQPKNKKLLILNRVPGKNAILGYQARGIGSYKSKYLTFELSKMYEDFGLEFPEMIPENKETLNRISTLFGIMSIDFGRSFTLFEGPIDAKFMKNTIGLATVGRNTDEFDEISTVRYFMDNDEAGKKKMIEKLKKGKSVFLWTKFLSDANIDTYIKDLNDLVKYCAETKNKHLNKINDYFSNSSFDMYHI
jgi:hypothetical protein